MKNISLQNTLILVGVLLFMYSEANAQSNWTNAGGAMQQKIVSGDTSIRFTKLSSYGQPFYITDELKKKLTINPDSSINIGGNKLKGVKSFPGISGYDLILGELPVTVSSARFAISDNISLLNDGSHSFGSYINITTEGSSSNTVGFADFDSKSTMSSDIDINHYLAFQARNSVTGSGNVLGYMYGYNVTNNHAGSGNISNHSGLHINDIYKTSTGTVTNNFGIEIEPIEGGVNNFAIKTKGGLVSFGSGLSKNNTSVIDVAYIGNSSEINYSALQVLAKGGATQSTREIIFQTIEQGVANDGILSLQPNGGKVKVSSVPDETTDVLRLTDLGTGWAQYTDNIYTSVSPFVVNASSTAMITNNAATSIVNQLPIGVSSFYDSSTSKITPELDGDSYLINVRFTAESSSVTGLCDVGIDIGGAMNIISQQTVSLRKGIGNSQRVNIIFDVFSGSTFLANGCFISLTSIDGNTSIYDISYKITRTHKAK